MEGVILAPQHHGKPFIILWDPFSYKCECTRISSHEDEDLMIKVSFSFSLIPGKKCSPIQI